MLMWGGLCHPPCLPEVFHFMCLLDAVCGACNNSSSYILRWPTSELPSLSAGELTGAAVYQLDGRATATPLYPVPLHHHHLTVLVSLTHYHYHTITPSHLHHRTRTIALVPSHSYHRTHTIPSPPSHRKEGVDPMFESALYDCSPCMQLIGGQVYIHMYI